MGRPSDYTEEIAIEIAARIAEGGSLRHIAEDDGMPSMRTMLTWCNAHPEFDRLLAHARLAKADVLMDDTVTIADEPVADMPQAQRNRNRIQARQYMAARLNPARYAEKIGVGAAPGLPPLQNGRSLLEAARRIAYVLRRGKEALEDEEMARRGAPLQLTYVERPKEQA